MNNETDRTYEDVRAMTVDQLKEALIELKVEWVMNDPEEAKEFLRNYFSDLIDNATRHNGEPRHGLINELYDSGYWS